MMNTPKAATSTKLTSEYYIDETAAEAIQMIMKKARMLTASKTGCTSVIADRLKFAEAVVTRMSKDLERA